jgi:hypothetical protein
MLTKMGEGWMGLEYRIGNLYSGYCLACLQIEEGGSLIRIIYIFFSDYSTK